MDIDTRLDLIKQVGEEIITEDELRALLEKKKNPVAYDGFEPSGRMHIAQGLLRALNVNRMIDAGCKFTMWVADWHAWANNKYGGDLDKIQTAGKLFIEQWKACGMNVDEVEFKWVSDVVKDDSYWKTVMQIARATTVKRILRTGQIMGRKEGEVQQTSQILYPVMQCADIFHLKVDICQLGMDQRKINMLAREIGPKLGYWAPVAVHHHMLMGLQKPKGTGAERKMSKSSPDSAIFMDDAPKEVERKINKAWCPEKDATENPLLEYCNYVIMPVKGNFIIQRPEKYGGEVEYLNYEDLASDYSQGKIHPSDLKKSVTDQLNELLSPIRAHFEKGKANELLKEVRKFKVTR
jgi:tyrosyl-tRNA synthetase